LNGLAAGRATVGLIYAATTDYDEYHGAGFSSHIRIADTDSTLTVSGFRSRSDPAERIIDRNDRYIRDRLTLGYGRPVVNSSERRITLAARLRAEDLAIDRTGIRLRDERLRIAEIEAQWLGTTSGSAQFLLRADVLKGLDDMGSGLRADDITSDPRTADFLILRLDYARAVRINGLWTWRLNALAQHSNDVVPYVERFRIGGDRLGRGFEVAAIAGDRGIGARAEIARNLPALGDGNRTLSVYLTYDLAAAWKNDRPGRESAATGSLGLSLINTRLSGRIELAKPLTHPDIEGRDDLSVFAELTLSW
jgi:hemolysin activation/secretion protein